MAYHLTDDDFVLPIVVRTKTNRLCTRNTRFRSFPLIAKERATLQTIKNKCTSCKTVFHIKMKFHIHKPSSFLNMILFRRNSHQENYGTAAPDDKKVMQEDQNSNYSASEDTEAELTAT